ncbi:Hypothetical protein, putative [Bodo saltans]|uniref:Uncharacterized protein n=1 Tax=Bodo saltans TaxID=75058 RepID=A0A0S4IL81_BODSA|nr:Hypothetical protein, putative [Bodo saltans]|eukprot:CUF22239.1 Hypothetical protein, putative [Bodo saltans]
MTAETFRGTAALEDLKIVLLGGLARVSDKHRRILLAIVKIIISEFGWDYLPQIMPSVEGFDCSNTASAVPLARALLDSVYVVAKRFKTLNLCPTQEKVVACQTLCTHLPKFFALNDMYVFHLTFKVFECCTETFQQLSAVKQQTLPIPVALVDSWLTYLGGFPQAFHAAAVASGEDGYRLYVKCVKRIGSICFSILHDATKKKKAAATAHHFLKNFSKPFVQMWIQWLSFCLESKDRAMHRKSEIFALRFLKMATADEQLFRAEIQPVALQLLEKQLFPFLCFMDSDEEVFNDEEGLQEYAQYMLDENVLTGEFSQRQAASNTILAMIGGTKSFHDPSLLMGVLQIIHTGLSSVDGTEESAKRTFGFLHLLGVLRKQIRGIPDVWNGQMEVVLSTSVAPLIASPHVFLKCKAIYICQRYSKIPWTQEASFASFMSAMAGLLQDPDARVRLTTIDAMCTLLEMKRARRYLMHVLVPLVNECLGFLEKVQTTFLPLVLNYLAEHFAAELTPVLDRLVGALVQQFLAAAFDMTAQEQTLGADDDLRSYETLGLSSFQTITAINNIIMSLDYNKAALTSMLPDVVRLLTFVFQRADSFDYMDKAIEIFQHAAFMAKPIPECLWNLFPPVYHCVMNSGTGVDYFSKFEGAFDNFVSNSPEAFLGNAQVMQMTFAMCEKMLVGGVVANDDDISAAPQLIEAMLHQAKHCENPALMSPHLSGFVSLLLRALVNPDNQKRPVIVRMWLITAVMDAFYFDAAATLQIIVDSGAYPHFFNGYFEFFSAAINADQATGKKNKKNRTEAAEVLSTLTLLFRKVNILGLTSLLLVVTNPANLPANPQSASFDPAFVTAAVKMIHFCIEENFKMYTPRCKNLEISIEQVRSGYEEEKEEDYDEEDMDLEEDQEEDLVNAANDDHDEEVDDEDGVMAEATDDYYTPIDKICEVDFYGQWVVPVRSLLASGQQPAWGATVSSLMLGDAAISQAREASQKYIHLLALLEKEQEADHQRRSVAALQPAV